MDTFTGNDRRPTLANQDYKEDENQLLPGFRFHPTDEELVGFYLRAKVDTKSMKVDHLIQEIDIYKQNPWDLLSMNFFHIYIYIFVGLVPSLGS